MHGYPRPVGYARQGAKPASSVRLADATVVVPTDFLRLPLIAAAVFVFYGERLDWLVFAGAAVMVAGNLANVLSECARSPRA